MLIEILFVLFCGLAMGSFITCASWRLPRGEDIIKKPSHCPVCKARLRFPDLWPVISWTITKGRCRYCGARVSARYPLTEIATVAAFLFLYVRYGLSAQGMVLALLAVALLIMIVVDLEHYLIPDSVHVALLPLGAFYHFLIGTQAVSALTGFLLGLGLGLLLHYGYRWLRKKEGLGFGDVKFLAVAGLWLTPFPFVPFLFYSGLFGVATALLWRLLGRGALFPFGPALAVALFLCVAYPELPALFWSMGGLVK